MAIRISKVFTKGGDKGMTSLVGGERISKASMQMDVVGSVDELNSNIGVLRTSCLDFDLEVESQLAEIQQQLFNLGSLAACPQGEIPDGMPKLSSNSVDELEAWIVKYQEDLGDLQSFVLPGGTPLNAQAHICRSVCRRVERLMLHFKTDWPGSCVAYINRLSDYFFVLARHLAKRQEAPEFLWNHTS
jgi:cob(I)alamin adenosyltransferase